MSKDILKAAAMFNTYSPLVDGSMNLTFQTQEVDKQMKSDIFDLHRQFGWVLFSPNEITVRNIPRGEAHAQFGESPSKKMRSTIYALYAEKGKPYGVTGFEKFYNETMEHLRSLILEEMSKLKG